MKIALQSLLTIACMGVLGFDIVIFVYSFEIIKYSIVYLVPFYILYFAMIFITKKVIEVSCDLSKSFNKDNK